MNSLPHPADAAGNLNCRERGDDPKAGTRASPTTPASPRPIRKASSSASSKALRPRPSPASITVRVSPSSVSGSCERICAGAGTDCSYGMRPSRLSIGKWAVPRAYSEHGDNCQCNCGAEYECTRVKFLMPHAGRASCEVCGAVLESWLESTHVAAFVAIVCWWSPYSQPGSRLLTVASRAEWPFRGLRSGGRAGGVPATQPSPTNSVGLRWSTWRRFDPSSSPSAIGLRQRRSPSKSGVSRTAGK
jgi:hypothetical protein